MAKKKLSHQAFSKVEPELLRKFLSLPASVGLEVMERVKYRLHEEKEAVLKQAYEEGLFTEKEYNERYKDYFYDDYGCDSFIQYINAAMNAKVDRFVTLNERVLQRRNELEEKFKLKIASPEEILQRSYH